MTSSSSSKKEKEYLTEIGPHDCLLGRGAGPNEHAGNISFRLVVSKHKKEYMATTNRQVKNLIAQRTIDLIKSNGGRFLQKVKGRDDEVYMLADDSVVLEKTKQALRHIERAKRAARRQGKGMEASTGSQSKSGQTSRSQDAALRTVTPTRASSPSGSASTCSVASNPTKMMSGNPNALNTLLSQGLASSVKASNTIATPTALPASFTRSMLESAIVASSPSASLSPILQQQQQAAQQLHAMLASLQEPQKQEQSTSSISSALAGLLGASNAASSPEEKRSTAVMIGLLTILSSMGAVPEEAALSQPVSDITKHLAEPARTSQKETITASTRAVAPNSHLSKPPTPEEQKILSLVLGIPESDTLSLSPTERLLVHQKAALLVGQSDATSPSVSPAGITSHGTYLSRN